MKLNSKFKTVKPRLDPLARFEAMEITADIIEALDQKLVKGKYITRSTTAKEITYYSEKSPKYLCYAFATCQLLKATQVFNNCGLEEGKQYIVINTVSFTNEIKAEYLEASK